MDHFSRLGFRKKTELLRRNIIKSRYIVGKKKMLLASKQLSKNQYENY